MSDRPLPRAFYERPTAEVARALLGKVIVRPRAGGEPLRARIVEVEAYLGVGDKASHARNGPTPRAAIMFGPPGRLYVYLIYGLHHCMNFVCERDGVAGAVLIRAAAPMSAPFADDPRALRGPGKVCQALAITLAERGTDLTSAGSALIVVDDGAPAPRIGRSARIGVDYAGAWARRLLRFFVPGHPSVSGSATGARTGGASRSAGRAGGPSSRARSTRTSPAATPRPGRRSPSGS